MHPVTKKWIKESNDDALSERLRTVQKEISDKNREVALLIDERDAMLIETGARIDRSFKRCQSAEKAYAAMRKKLDVAIAFHESNTNDPHNVGNAVVCALREVRTALG